MIDVIVVSRTQEALDICSFELASADGASLPYFSAGAHIDVHLSDGIVRQYSLCNHPEEIHRYLIGVLKDPASRGGSKALHEQIQVGHRLTISEPKNLFPLEPAAHRSLLFAGGIGITPILCMAERLSHTGMDFELHYCARSSERAAFTQRIKASPFADRVFFHFDEEPETTLKTANVLADPQPGTHLYVCGPGGFMQHVLDTGKAQGWADDHLHREYFSAAPVDTSNDGSFTVRIGSTGESYEVPADQTVLQVLERHGIEIPVSCEQGVCGTCLTRVLEGTPDHRDMFLTKDEQAANDQFTPCCSRSKSPTLVLDI
ncbi:PDR/VanB family oxidoreductase [Pseudomonas sp. G5(2012)]|uniref:PDR/VanB family oxidoreductase n=1 Tax=Pseudomonas sp. G5(2012) TaxID=1268068 RepID=UPI0009DBC2F4|nr:PDR/VanB family oxidoreductase [Pseudomonas sp. G5(2012)]